MCYLKLSNVNCQCMNYMCMKPDHSKNMSDFEKEKEARCIIHEAVA